MIIRIKDYCSLSLPFDRHAHNISSQIVWYLYHQKEQNNRCWSSDYVDEFDQHMSLWACDSRIRPHSHLDKMLYHSTSSDCRKCVSYRKIYSFTVRIARGETSARLPPGSIEADISNWSPLVKTAQLQRSCRPANALTPVRKHQLCM